MIGHTCHFVRKTVVKKLCEARQGEHWLKELSDTFSQENFDQGSNQKDDGEV
jgi:hypothetical protein